MVLSARALVFLMMGGRVVRVVLDGNDRCELVSGEQRPPDAALLLLFHSSARL